MNLCALCKSAGHQTRFGYFDSEPLTPFFHQHPFHYEETITNHPRHCPLRSVHPHRLLCLLCRRRRPRSRTAHDQGRHSPCQGQEFAKKYGVSMTLNEDKIDSLAQVLTVEQMEEDFRKAAIEKGHISTIIFPTGKVLNINRIKIKRTKSMSENNSELRGSKSIEEGSGDCYILINGVNRRAGITVSWVFYGNKNHNVSCQVSYGSNTGEDDNMQVIYSTSPHLAFTATGDVNLSDYRYKRSAHVIVTYDGSIDRLSAQITCF